MIAHAIGNMLDYNSSAFLRWVAHAVEIENACSITDSNVLGYKIRCLGIIRT
jgi:hypothetical protein